MNKRYEKERKPFFSEAGEKLRKQYVWAKDEENKEYLQETEPIEIQAEIESYADECDIKNIVRKASFDPQFLKSLSEGAMTGAEVDVTEFPKNIHEYHRMMATAQAKMMEIQQATKTVKAEAKSEEEAKTE
nr:MAG TPA: Scaffold protein [Microviridae sp.]